MLLIFDAGQHYFVGHTVVMKQMYTFPSHIMSPSAAEFLSIHIVGTVAYV